MKVNYSVNYSGYIPVLRSILLMAKTKQLSLAQFGAYIFLVMQAAYDPRHKHHQIITPDDKELAKGFGLNPSTIYRHKKELVELGLLIEDKNKITKVTNYHMFELQWTNRLVKLPASVVQELFAEPPKDIAYFENLIANLQESQPQKPSQSFTFPSKSDSLSDEEKEWIDKNVMEVNIN